MKIRTVLIAAAMGVFAWDVQATTFSFTDDFKGVPTALPGQGTKFYPDQKNWAFTFWPGIQWPTSYGDGTNWLAGNWECEDYVTPLLTSIKGTSVAAQYRYNPFYIESDGLHIRASLLSGAQQQAYQIGSYRRFGSGMLMMRAGFTYGKVNIVAKMPSSLGSWPAFWLLAENHQWPPELDIVEAMPWKEHIQQIHTGVILPSGQSGGAAGWVNVNTDITKAFHNYGLIWTPTTITMTFDGKTIWQEATPAAMNQPMYLIINHAVGGSWVFNELGVGTVDDTSTSRLVQGANLIQGDFPGDLVIKSVTITSP